MSDFYLERVMCDVLSEMRKCNETRNYAPLAGLIEEVQTMGNRMEAAISYKNGYERSMERAKKAAKRLNDLEKKIEEAEEKLAEIEEQIDKAA